MTTVASTTAISVHLFQPASTLLDHKVSRGLVRSPPTAHGSVGQPCPFNKRKGSPLTAACQSFDVATGDDESIASLSRRQPAGPNPPTNRLCRSAGYSGRSPYVQFIRC
jgi:hypothetical protein